MIRGLRIAMRGSELMNKITERIRAHELTVEKHNARLKEREKDMSFDVRPEDDYKTVGDLERERDQYRDRVTHLTLLRDNVMASETYLLSRADLRVSDLLSTRADPGMDMDESWIPTDDDRAIHGLKLTIDGEQVRTTTRRL